MIRAHAFTALPLLLAAVLCGCSTDHGADAAKVARAPTEQFPIKTTEHADEIRLAAHAEGLSAAQGDAVSDLVGRWLADGGGAVTIQAPTRGADPAAVYAASQAARSLMLSLGVPAERIARVGYEPTGPGPAPIIVGFAAYQAEVPKCGASWGHVSATTSNKPMDNFGCAVSANMAAQIANPGDLAEPRALDPADARRRALVMDKYRQGQPTATVKDVQASGVVSSAGGGG